MNLYYITLTYNQARLLSESQKDSSWFLPERFSLEDYSYEISPDDHVMVALKTKRAEHLSRICILQTSFTSWEPELMHNFSERVLSFQPELQSLILDPTSQVCRESQALDASVASLMTLFQREIQAQQSFQTERYGKRIQMVSDKFVSVQREITTKKQEHERRIQALQELCRNYDGIVANADDVFLKFQSHIKTVNSNIEDIQACISRCFDNPQSISFTDRIKHGFGEFGSDWRSKGFRGSIEEQKQNLQAKVDQQLKRPEEFYANTSTNRKKYIDCLKSEATNAISQAKKLSEDYLNALTQPLDAPLQASKEFTVWLVAEVKKLADFFDHTMNPELDAVSKFVTENPAFSESR